VREIGLAPRGDLVDMLDFGFDRADELLAARNGLHVSLEPSASCLISASRVSTAASFFSPKATCARRPSSCLNIPSARAELIFRGLNLTDGVALPALHAIELSKQLVLDG